MVTTTMASPWKCFCILLLHLQPCACLHRQPADSAASVVHDEESNGRMKKGGHFVLAEELQIKICDSTIQNRNHEVLTLFTTRVCDQESPHLSHRKLLQTPGVVVPFPPLKVLSNGQPCVMLQARKLSLRYEKQKQLDLTERAFSPQRQVDTSQSVCRQDKATLVMRFGDVEDLRGLVIRLELSNTFYESSSQWWFSVDSVSLFYNTSEEAVFNASEVYAPASSSYRCLHVSSLQRYSGLLLPSTDNARRWSITFVDFQIQAFNMTSGKFSPASDCTIILTPAILMGLITSLILLLVLAYALHMVVHLKHIEHDDDHKADIYFPQSAEEFEHCCDESINEKNII